MTEDAQSDMLRLAAGLAEMQRELDASRADTQVRDSERRRLAREVDILSHLLCSHEVDAQRVADASLANAHPTGRDGLIVDPSDPDAGSTPNNNAS